ncbi:uracil phosphoribosyltransferase [Candidatus Woesearchaeota archaeon]|nr:uracil phosphoribosyltransferase [Candidatus Woesearchaeota archaeon]
MFKVVEHPLVQNSLGLLRDINTPQEEFRRLCSGIASILCYEAARDWELEEATVPLWTGEQLKVRRLSDRKIILLPILRAGLGMCEGLQQLFPSAPVYHLGIKRDETTLQPRVYYDQLPSNLEAYYGIILDPMLATGGSLDAAITRIKGCGCEDITVLCIVAAPEGVNLLEERHPDVKIYAAALDERLNSKGYILPGLGDAGDRMFGT